MLDTFGGFLPLDSLSQEDYFVPVLRDLAFTALFYEKAPVVLMHKFGERPHSLCTAKLRQMVPGAAWNTTFKRMILNDNLIEKIS